MLTYADVSVAHADVRTSANARAFSRYAMTLHAVQQASRTKTGKPGRLRAIYLYIYILFLFKKIVLTPDLFLFFSFFFRRIYSINHDSKRSEETMSRSPESVSLDVLLVIGML